MFPKNSSGSGLLFSGLLIWLGIVCYASTVSGMIDDSFIIKIIELTPNNTKDS